MTLLDISWHLDAELAIRFDTKRRINFHLYL